MTEDNNLIVTLGSKILHFTFGQFDDNIDVDDLTRIHYENLFGEAVTVSTILNRIGIFRAEAEDIYEGLKLDAEVYESERKQELRKLAKDTATKITDKAVEEEMIVSKNYKLKWKAAIKAKKNLGIINSIYWSIQSKDSKLSVLMNGITPEEFESGIIEGKINHIYIKKRDKLIKGSQE